MIPRRALTVCVGVSAYPPTVLEPGEQPLRFLAASAGHLSALFATMWPDGSKHLSMTDEGASLARLNDLLGAEGGEYDIFVLYLGGHGRGGGRPFQFLFHGPEPNDAIASARHIDGLLERPRAPSTLLLLDCCYAGAYAQESASLRSVGRASSRLCIASSLPDQKSWEDPYFERSLFADAVIKALTEKSRQPPPAKRVATEFFDEIAADVARHAFALKGSSAQEPVLVGASRAPLSLPTAAPAAVGRRSMTTFDVLVRRSRQIAVAVALLAVVGAALTSYTTWRPALNGSGNVELRPGPKWLSPLNVGWWQRRVETNITGADLKDEELRATILDERGVRPWPGLNSGGVRRWASAFVDEFLNAEAAARWRVRLGYADAVDRFITAGRAIVPTRTVALHTATELAAEAKLLKPTEPLSEAWRLQWRNNVSVGSCSGLPLPKEQADLLSFYLDLSEPSEYAHWLRGLALTAAADDAVGLKEVAQLVEMFTAANHTWREEYTATIAAPDEPLTAARIAARFTERPTRAEVSALARVAAAVVARRSDNGMEPVTGAERARLIELMEGCQEVAAPVLAALGPHGDPARVVAWAYARSRSDQGRTALHELATRGALPDEAIAWVLDTLGFRGDASDRKRAFVNGREWLTAVADARPLPDELVIRLFDYAGERLKAGDGESSRQAISVIVRTPLGARAVSDPRFAALLLPTDRAPLPLGDADIERLGLLARSGAMLSIVHRNALLALLDNTHREGLPRVIFTEEDRGGQGNAIQLVAGLNSTHLLALARFFTGSQDGTDDPRVLPFLELALSDALRFGMAPDRLREVALAAAIALERHSDQPIDAARLRDQLRCCASDTAARQARIELGVALLGRMPLGRRAAALDDLRTYWHREREPEVKLAIAEVIIRSAASNARATSPDAR